MDGTICEDEYFTYTVDGGDLIVVEKSSGEYITIENFNDGDLDKGAENFYFIATGLTYEGENISANRYRKPNQKAA